MYCVPLYVSPPVTANRASLGLGWISRTHDTAVGLNRVLTFEHSNQNRPRRHECRETIKEWAFLMDGVEPLCFCLTQGDKLRGNNFQSCTFKAAQDVSDGVLFHCIGLHNRQ